MWDQPHNLKWDLIASYAAQLVLELVSLLL
jgi:hypothetical protein